MPSAFAATRDGIDVMLRDRGPAPDLARDRPAESLLRGAHASAVLEGSASTLDEVRDGAGDEVAAAAVRVSHRAARRWRRCWAARRCRRFARLHALAAAGRCPTTGAAGRATPRPPTGCAASATC